jgi:DNA mismatch repair protein MutH
MTPEELAGLAIALLAGSELLSYIPGVKANGWVQLILAALRGIAAAAQAEQNTKRRRR